VALVASAWAPASARLATAICLASGVLYSVGPRLKRYPVLGTLSNVTNFAPLLWVGASSSGGTAPGLSPLAVAFVCLLLQNQLLHEAADRQEDVRARVCTTVLLVGERRAALVAAVLGAGLLAAARPAHAFAVALGPLAAAYVVFFPLVLAARGSDPTAMNRARMAHRACSVVTGGLLFALLR
jgi:4-hydroxybenzoate polyprenyltransferase